MDKQRHGVTQGGCNAFGPACASAEVLSSRVYEVESRLSRIEKCIFGNGQPGLKTLLYILLAISLVRVPFELFFGQ